MIEVLLTESNIESITLTSSTNDDGLLLSDASKQCWSTLIFWKEWPRFSSTCIEKPINKKSITFKKEKIVFTIKEIKEDNIDQSAEVRDIRYQEYTKVWTIINTDQKHMLVNCEWTRDLNGARTWENSKVRKYKMSEVQLVNPFLVVNLEREEYSKNINHLYYLTQPI